MVFIFENVGFIFSFVINAQEFNYWLIYGNCMFSFLKNYQTISQSGYIVYISTVNIRVV